jgi:hypothetical protein
MDAFKFILALILSMAGVYLFLLLALSGAGL